MSHVRYKQSSQNGVSPRKKKPDVGCRPSVPGMMAPLKRNDFSISFITQRVVFLPAPRYRFCHRGRRSLSPTSSPPPLPWVGPGNRHGDTGSRATGFHGSRCLGSGLVLQTIMARRKRYLLDVPRGGAAAWWRALQLLVESGTYNLGMPREPSITI